ncbi:MAG: AsmA family protein [Bacteroidaceae bacterium]|nr:AsmA family protein [Bacteroidaceae bacterium]
MKKVLKVTAAIVAVILLLLVSIPYLFMGEVETLIKKEGNKMLNAEFDFGGLDISLIRNFPLASLTIEDFYLKGIGEFENDTLLSAGEVTAAVNVMSLFGDEGFDIKKILLDDVSVTALVLPDGCVNWDVLKDSGEEETEEDGSSPFRIKLQELTIDDFNLVYDDRLGNMYARVKNMDAGCSGDFGSSRTLLELVAGIEALTFSMDGVPFLNSARIAADMNVDADLENSKFTLKENTLELNAIKAAVDGWVAMTDKGMDMDLKLNSNEIGFKEILSLIPAIYTQDFEGLKTDGQAVLSAFAKGSLEGDSVVPQFNVDLNVKDAMFQYPSLPAGVSKINIAANISNAGGDIDATVVKVAPFSFVMANNPFSVSATLNTPISDMQFDVAAKGVLDLGKIKDIYPLEDMALNGVVNADMSIKGRMSNIEKEEYEKITASGNVRLNNMLLTIDDMPDIDIKKSLLSFTPRYLQLDETAINIGGNDITLDSRFENYMGYLLKGTTIKGNLNVKSNRFNLNDFMSDDSAAPEEEDEEEEIVEPDTAGMSIIRVPENIDFVMNADFKELLFDNMTFRNVNGKLDINKGKVDMKNLSLETMGGKIVVNGFYNAPAGIQPEFNASLKLSDIVFAQAYKELGVVQKMAPIFGGITGAFSGNMKINTKLDDTMSPVLPTLKGSGMLTTKDVSLDGVTVIQNVADILKKPNLKNTRVKDLKLEFTIEDGRIDTKPFDVKLGEYKMRISGSTGLDQTIDYRGEIAIPESLGQASRLGSVDMTIGGTFTSPKVKIDLESLAKNAAKEATKDAVGKLLGVDVEKVVKGDSTMTKEEKKKEAAKQIFNAAKGLFKK